MGTPGMPGGEPPAFAQDAAQVLAQLGFTAEQCQRLRDAGATPGLVS